MTPLLDAVTDIFLPKWFADRILPICGTTYGVALVIILLRMAGGLRHRGNSAGA